MGDAVAVVTDAVETVSLSGVMRVGCRVRTRLCALSRCDAIDVDMINPRVWSKCVRGSMAL